jgi:NAD(P)-dependent dehydrogenase (short-subunit alcohol dehydrogenase family)
MVDAALVGLDQRELVTIPNLQDSDDWTRFEAARRILSGRFGNSVPAPRYGIGAPRRVDRPPQRSAPSSASLGFHKRYCWRRRLSSCWSTASHPYEQAASLRLRALANKITAITTKEHTMGKLEGKVALVTGGNSGIGLATAKQFVNEGAYVFITGHREPELAAAVKEIGNNVTGVQGDVSNLGDLDRLLAQIKQEKGKLDIVFANAGVAKYAPLGTITEEFYDSIFNINVKGLLFTVQKALPLLEDGASIILNASIVASKGLPTNSVYSATKAAVRSFARTWTTDLKDRRIRVNAVSPGATDTPGLNDLLASTEAGQQRLNMISTTVPLGRLGTPDEIARAVVFLASDDSSFITGAELFVDGGFAQV